MDEDGKTDIVRVEEQSEADKEDEMYSLVDNLTAQQIVAAQKLVLFPNQTLEQTAESVGVTARTISTWKTQPEFAAFVAMQRREMAKRTLDVASHRRAALIDKLAEELLPRFEEPERDPVKLAAILGNQYTEKDRQRYEERFVTNIHAKDLLKIYGIFDKNLSEEARSQAEAMDEDDLVDQIRRKHEELRIREKNMQGFSSMTGFNFSTNIHDEDPLNSFRSDVITMPQEEENIEDAEFEEIEQPSVLDKYSF